MSLTESRSFIQSLVAGIVGMGLIAASFTGTIDEVNAPFGLTPRKEVFAIKLSETEKLEKLLEKLQVEPPEELNVDGANGVSADTPLSEKSPVSLEKETEKLSVDTAKKEEITESEMAKSAAKKADISPPKKAEEPNIFIKKTNEGEGLSALPKIETKNELDTNKVELTTKQQGNKPSSENAQEPIASTQGKIDDSNTISNVAKQQELPPVVKSTPMGQEKAKDVASPVQEKAQDVAPPVAPESTKPAPMQTDESSESDELTEEPKIAKMEKDDKLTLQKEEPTTSKNKGEKPKVDSSSTTKLEAELPNQKENAESLFVPSNENKVPSGTEKVTIAATTSESLASKLTSDAVNTALQKNDETPSDKPKTTTMSVVPPIVSSAPISGSVAKLASDVTGSVSKALENLKAPEAQSGGAASTSKAIESLNIPDSSSIEKDSFSKISENQKIPTASDLTDVVAKSLANFKFPDTSQLRDTVSKVLEEVPRNPAALAAIGTVLSATIISTALGMLKGPSSSDTKSEKKSSTAPNGATTSNDRDGAIPKSRVSEGAHASKKSLTPLEKRFSAEPLPKNGYTSPTGKATRFHAKEKHSTSRPSNRSPSSKSSIPPISKTPNGSGDRAVGPSTTKSMTPLEKKFGATANGSQTSQAAKHQHHEHSKAKSAPFPSVTSPGPTNSKTPLEKKFAAQDVANNNGLRNGSTRSTSSNGKGTSNTPINSTSVKSKTPLEQKFERDAAERKNGATKPSTESVKPTANPTRDTADQAVKAKPMSDGPSKPPLKGKATITKSKRKYIMDAEFEPVPSNGSPPSGSNKSDTTSDHNSSPALTNTPIVLDAAMNDVKGFVNKVSGKNKDSASSSVILDDALMDSIKEYVKQQAESSASPVAVDALMESVKEYVQKQAGSKALIVLDDALMESIKEYVNKQAGSISDSSTSR